jgi:hypothetical protein
MSSYDGQELAVRYNDQGVELYEWDENALRSVSSWDDLAELARANDLPVTDVSKVLGDGFTLIDNAKDKRTLIGVPFVIVSWAQVEGDRTDAQGVKAKFTTMRIMTKDGRKLIVNDGSTGIHAQVNGLIKQQIRPFVKVSRGLRVSDYEYTDPTSGETSSASTFYLDTAAE